MRGGMVKNDRKWKYDLDDFRQAHERSHRREDKNQDPEVKHLRLEDTSLNEGPSGPRCTRSGRQVVDFRQVNERSHRREDENKDPGVMDSRLEDPTLNGEPNRPRCTR